MYCSAVWLGWVPLVVVFDRPVVLLAGRRGGSRWRCGAALVRELPDVLPARRRLIFVSARAGGILVLHFVSLCFDRLALLRSPGPL